jgi:hypothetical protein
VRRYITFKLDLKRRPQFGASLESQIINWLSKQKPAISGQSGHNRTFAVACGLIHGFNLELDVALPFFTQWSEYCEPPWTEQELVHKLADAQNAKRNRGEGYLLREFYKRGDKIWTEKQFAEIDWSLSIYLPEPECDWSQAVYLQEHNIDSIKNATDQ